MKKMLYSIVINPNCAKPLNKKSLDQMLLGEFLFFYIAFENFQVKLWKRSDMSMCNHSIQHLEVSWRSIYVVK